MKKIGFFLSAAILMASSASAETNPQTAQFLRKLNLYYYCPSREGLKGLTCDLTVHASAIYKKSLNDLGCPEKITAALDGQKLTFTLTSDGKGKLALVDPTPSGDAAYDSNLKEQLTNIVKNFDPVLQTWTDDVFKPGFDEETLTKADCSVVNKAHGFIVEQMDGDGSGLKVTFDEKAKRVQAIGVTKAGKVLVTMKLYYSNTPKGYQLDGYWASVPKMNFIETDHFEYQPVGNFTLPKAATKEFQFGEMFEKGSTVTLDFSNYQLIP